MWQDWPIRTIRVENKGFPERLGLVTPEVKKLYYRGNWHKRDFKHALAVVGSRRMTSYGKGVVEKLIPPLARAGVTIVSGMMYGVDLACLAAGGKTVAVLGSGLDVTDSEESGRLYSQILQSGGLVLSEYERDSQPALWTYPQRNRIVAGLSGAVLVIEGGEKSGTLITAKLGFKQKKPVMAVPGPITSSNSLGVNWLIKNGAVAVTSAEEVLAELGIKSHSRSEKELTSKVALDSLEVEGLGKRILAELNREPLEVDELARKLGMDVVSLGQKLSLMEIAGLVKEQDGKYTSK